jgi:antitoxin YefM
MYVIPYVQDRVLKERRHSMTVTATEARQNLFQLVKKSVRGHIRIKISSKEGEAVLIAEEDYESLLETLELLSMPGMRKSIQEAKADVRAGRTKSIKEIFG